MGTTLYEKHQLLDKIADILKDCDSNELMSAHEIAVSFSKLYPQTFKTLGKPIGGDGKTQDTLTRYIARLIYPAQKSPAEVRRRFVAYVFGRSGVSALQFKDGTSQQMHPAYGVALFALRREEN